MDYDFIFKQIPVQVVDIKSMGPRIVISDSQESVHFMRYKKAVSYTGNFYLIPDIPPQPSITSLQF